MRWHRRSAVFRSSSCLCSVAVFVYLVRLFAAFFRQSLVACVLQIRSFAFQSSAVRCTFISRCSCRSCCLFHYVQNRFALSQSFNSLRVLVIFIDVCISVVLPPCTSHFRFRLLLLMLFLFLYLMRLFVCSVRLFFLSSRFRYVCCTSFSSNAGYCVSPCDAH